jgi:hypothetical protein
MVRLPFRGIFEQAMSKDDSIRDEIRTGFEIANECRAILSNFRDAQRAHWLELAGSHLPPMLKSRLDAERYLNHPEPNVRITSIEVLAHHWKTNESLVNACRQIAFSDPDSVVRNVALITFGSYYSGTNDAGTGRLLARIVRDEQQPAKFRSAAYCALFKLRPGAVLFWDGLNQNPPTDFPFPDQVDWPLVDSYLDG